MMKTTYLAVILASVALAGACGSNPSTGNANAPGAKAANTQNVNAAAPGIPDTGEGARAALPEGESTPAGPINMPGRREIVESGPLPPGLKQPTAQAGENSTISTIMDKQGAVIQTRTFNGDKDIAKLELTTRGRENTARLYLKNGKTMDVPFAQVANLSGVTKLQLRELAGLVTQPAVPIQGKPKTAQ